MPDIYDMQLDAYPSVSEINKLLCSHDNIKFNRIHNSLLDSDMYFYTVCADCGVEIESDSDET